MKTILEHLAVKHPRDWQLPAIACQALGAAAEESIPAAAALACAQISIILVDDMLDDDPRGEYHRTGKGRAANFAIAFQAASLAALTQSHASASIKVKTLNSLNQMMITTAYGQELDIQNPIDEATYWRVVENKSSPFYGCALRLGALFAEATEPVAERFEQLGRIYGEMIQIHDDLSDTMAVPANADWLQKRKPLPILFALTVEHPERDHFIEFYQNVSAEHALQEAQEILIRCGAVSYCVDQLRRRHQAARNIFNTIQLTDKREMETLIEGLIAPVWHLFASLGMPPPRIATVEEPTDRE
jgi:geranylgeranyl pyrophosphate synthase